MSRPFFPLLAIGTVVSHHPERHAVYVMLRSGQMPGNPIPVAIDGPADAVRVSYGELPSKGTWGLIAFPNNDPRNGVWVCSYYSQNQDAITNGPTDAFTSYKTEWSGYWEHRDSAGNDTKVYPDGTRITCSATGEAPTTYRHVVDGNNLRQRTEFTQAERVSVTPPPFILDVAHASGTLLQVDGTGNVNVTGNANATLTLNFGATTLVINSGGDMVVTAGSTTFTIDKNGQIALDAGANPVNITASTVAMMVASALSVSANGGAVSQAAVLAAALVSWLTSHTHTGVNGTTSTPNQSLTTADIASTTVTMSG